MTAAERDNSLHQTKHPHAFALCSFKTTVGETNTFCSYTIILEKLTLAWYSRTTRIATRCRHLAG